MSIQGCDACIESKRGASSVLADGSFGGSSPSKIRSRRAWSLGSKIFNYLCWFNKIIYLYLFASLLFFVIFYNIGIRGFLTFNLIAPAPRLNRWRRRMRRRGTWRVETLSIESPFWIETWLVNSSTRISRLAFGSSRDLGSTVGIQDVEKRTHHRRDNSFEYMPMSWICWGCVPVNL